MQASLSEIRSSLRNQRETLPLFTYLLIAQDLLKEATFNLNFDNTKLIALSLQSIKVNYANTLTEYMSIEIDNNKTAHKERIAISAQNYVHQIFSILDKLLHSTNKKREGNHDQRSAELIKEHFKLYFEGKNNDPLGALESLSTLIRIINDEAKNTPFQIEEADKACVTPCNTEETENPKVISTLIEHEEIFSPRGKTSSILDIFSPRGTKIAPLETSDLQRDAVATSSIQAKPQPGSFSSYFFGTPTSSGKNSVKIAVLS